MNLYFQHSDFTMEFVASGFNSRDDPNIYEAIKADVHKRNPKFKIYYTIANLYDNGDVCYDISDHNCFYFLTDRFFMNGEKWACTWDREIPEC